MAVWSTIEFQDLDLSDRIDAEYFQPSFLSVATALEGRGKKLGELGKITCSAFYPAATHLYSEEGVPFVRCVDVISHPVIDEHQPFERVPLDFVVSNRPIQTVASGDIVITKVGTPCYASIVHDSLTEAALTRTVLGIKNIKREEVNPYYLVVFLRGKYGYYQLMREREQQIQLQLTLERVAKVNVYLPPRHIQDEIGDNLKKYYDLLRRARKVLGDATGVFQKEFAVNAAELNHETTYVSYFSEALLGSRLDAEYFQPKYQRVIDALRKSASKVVHLEDLLRVVTNGHTPLHHNLEEGDVAFLTAEHVLDFDIDYQSDKRILLEHHNNELKRTQLQVGDILATIKGRIGNFARVEQLDGLYNINQDVALLRLKPNIHPYYVIGYLNSLPGKTLVQQLGTGQINPFLGLGNLKKIPIPLLERSRMNALGSFLEDEVLCSQRLKSEAEALLDASKLRIEQMIESQQLS